MRLLGISSHRSDFVPNFLKRLLHLILECAKLIINLVADFAARFASCVTHVQEKDGADYEAVDSQTRHFFQQAKYIH